MLLVAIAYHKPGLPGAETLVARLARTVEALTGHRTVWAEFDSLTAAIPDSCGLGVVLTLARGGHYYVASHALERKCQRVAGPVPHGITALHAANWLARSGCNGRVVLSYHGAKRYRDEQKADYERIASLTSAILREWGVGCIVTAAPHTESGAVAGAVRLGVLPGRRDGISLLAEEPGFSLVAAWIAGLP